MNGPHVTPIKRLVNVPLRFIQRPFTDRPWLLASVFVGERWTGRYVFCRVQMKAGWRLGKGWAIFGRPTIASAKEEKRW